jgi:hypothetical protein
MFGSTHLLIQHLQLINHAGADAILSSNHVVRKEVMGEAGLLIQ